VKSKNGIKPGDLVTAQFGNGIQMFQNMYTSKMRSAWMPIGEVGLVIGTYSGGIGVLFKGEEWTAVEEKLRVVNEEESQ